MKKYRPSGEAKLVYHAAYYQTDDEWIVARVLDFPGVSTQGRNLQAARWMVRDALRLMASSLIESLMALPKPNPRASDKKAVFVETVPLNMKVMSDRPNVTGTKAKSCPLS